MSDLSSQTVEYPTPDLPLVLVGLMGAGKTTVGRRLARKLSLPFIDSDAEIEKQAGCTITEIFEREGEEPFRALERTVIQDLLLQGPAVISTGGGAFINPDTRKLVLQQSISIWLKADLETLYRRVAHSTHRPLLRENPRKVLKRLIDERYPVYAEAAITVDCNVRAHNTVVRRILKALREKEQA